MTRRSTTRVVRSAALGSSLPPLVITYTNEQHSIAEWLNEHVPLQGDGGDDAAYCLGLDTETKPSFTKQTALAKKGPDVLQLAKSDGKCLVIHLSQMEQLQELVATSKCNNVADLFKLKKKESSLMGYIQLAQVLNSRRVAKAGVSIDDDALELHENKLLGVNCRLELRKMGLDEEEENLERGHAKQPSNTHHKSGKAASINQGNKKGTPHAGRPQSLKGLAEYLVPGLHLRKQKKLQMSNWEQPLSDAQVGYAAADAFAGAIVVHALVTATDNPHTIQSLLDLALEKETSIQDLRGVRVQNKKERKIEAEKRRKDKKSKPKGGASKRKAATQNGMEVDRAGTGGGDKSRQNNNKMRKLSDQDVHPLYKELSSKR